MYKKLCIVVALCVFFGKSSFSMHIEALDNMHDHCSSDAHVQSMIDFQNAITSGDLQKMKDVLSFVNVLGGVEGVDGDSWLHLAVKARQRDVVNYLLEQGVSPFILNNDRKLPIDLAYEFKSYDTFFALAEKMKMLYFSDAPLNSFISEYFPVALRQFLSFDIRVFHAIKWKNKGAVDQLICEDKSRAFKKMPYFNLSPLALALFVGAQEVIDILRSNGAKE